jgi:hypothetical protein
MIKNGQNLTTILQIFLARGRSPLLWPETAPIYLDSRLRDHDNIAASSRRPPKTSFPRRQLGPVATLHW